MITADPDVWAQAACIPKIPGDFDDALWFPGRGDSRSARRAKAICRTCPLREMCLAAALAMSPRPQGVWGGTTDKERDALRGGRTVKPTRTYVHGTEYGYRREVSNGETPCGACTEARDEANRKRAERYKRKKAVA